MSFLWESLLHAIRKKTVFLIIVFIGISIAMGRAWWSGETITIYEGIVVTPLIFEILFWISAAIILALIAEKPIMKFFEHRENAKPENQLRGLADDVRDLAFYDKPSNRTNLGRRDNPVYVALADNTFKILGNICDIQKPERLEQYPTFFEGILPFVRRGDIKAVEEASLNICQTLSKKGGTVNIGGGIEAEIKEG